MSMEGFGDFDQLDSQQNTNLDFGESADDAFGAAVSSDPFGSQGMQMSNQ